jgi:tetratricopeptide (TPR) repeat protein
MNLNCFGLILFATLLASSCQQSDSESVADSGEPEELVIRDSVVCHSLFGKALKHPPETRSSYRKKDSLLNIARTNYEADSRNLENIVWYGRRLGYLTEYPKAMSVYTRGLHLHPKSPEIYRHRGHRYISMRRFEEAVNDLTLAAELARGRDIEIEPDGIPNKLNKPLSSLQFNIWYHLGLAYYLQGKYEDAARAYENCLAYSTNDDLLTATTDWYYWTAIRMGDTQKAEELLKPITVDMEIVENDAYHKRLLMYKGIINAEDIIPLDLSEVEDEHIFVTQGYGVANYLHFKGRDEEARALINKILETDAWPSFGFIAAEADKAIGI